MVYFQELQETTRRYITEDRTLHNAHNQRFRSLKANDRSHAVQFGIWNASTCGINLIVYNFDTTSTIVRYEH
jgi:hypothetical protein